MLNVRLIMAMHRRRTKSETTPATRKEWIIYDEALTSSKTTEEFRSKIKPRLPDLGLDAILKIGFDAAFSKETMISALIIRKAISEVSHGTRIAGSRRLPMSLKVKWSMGTVWGIRASYPHATHSG